MNKVAAVCGLVLVLVQDMVAATGPPTMSPTPPVPAGTPVPNHDSHTSQTRTMVPVRPNDHRQYKCSYVGYFNDPNNKFFDTVDVDDVGGCAEKCTDDKAFMFAKSSALGTNCYCFAGDPTLINPTDFLACPETGAPPQGWALYEYKQAHQCDVWAITEKLKGDMHHFDKCPRLQMLINDAMCVEQACDATGKNAVVCRPLFQQYPPGPGEDLIDVLKKSCHYYEHGMGPVLPPSPAVSPAGSPALSPAGSPAPN